MRMRLAASAAAVAAILLATSASAANITWSAPVDITGSVSDILTTGSLVGAVTAGTTSTINGVTFVGQTGLSGGTTSFGAAPISIGGMNVQYGGFNNAPGGWDANYRQILAGGTWNNDSSQPVITLTGLTAGNSYVVQIFEASWNLNWATKYTGGANTSAFVNLSGGDVEGGAGGSSVPQYLTGTFVADGATQAIVMSAGTSAVEVFAAMQVRTADVAAVPEAATWGMMILGFGLTGATMRRRSRATLRLQA